MSIIIEEKTKLGLILRFEFPDTLLKKDIDKEMAATFLDISYRPFIQKLVILLEYTLISGDYDFVEKMEDIISNISKEKLKGT